MHYGNLRFNNNNNNKKKKNNKRLLAEMNCILNDGRDLRNNKIRHKRR